MNQNVLAHGWRRLVGGLENSKEFGNSGFVLSKALQWAIPIVRVPTNIAIEAGVNMTGLLSGSAKLLQVMHRGIATMEPAEADFILRHMSKGMVGAGLFYLGFANPEMFGGFYRPGEKRDPDDVKWGGARVKGVNIPAWLLHAPAFIVINAGSTFRRVLDKRGSHGGPWKATTESLKGLMEEIPFFEGIANVDHLLSSGYEGTKARGMTLSGSVLPQFSRDIAHDRSGEQISEERIGLPPDGNPRCARKFRAHETVDDCPSGFPLISLLASMIRMCSSGS